MSDLDAVQSKKEKESWLYVKFFFCEGGVNSRCESKKVLKVDPQNEVVPQGVESFCYFQLEKRGQDEFGRPNHSLSEDEDLRWIYYLGARVMKLSDVPLDNRLWDVIGDMETEVILTNAGRYILKRSNMKIV